MGLWTAFLRLTDDADGDGGEFGVGYGDVEFILANTYHLREAFYFAEDTDCRGLAGEAEDFDAVPLYEAAAEGFRYGLFGGPPTGVVALGEAELLAVGDLLFGEESLADPRRPFEGELHPLDVYHVHADAWNDEIFHVFHRVHGTVGELFVKEGVLYRAWKVEIQ